MPMRETSEQPHLKQLVEKHITYVLHRTDGYLYLVHSVRVLRVDPSLLSEESTFMLWVIPVVLLLLWLIGFYGGFVTNSLIHLLIVGAVVILAINFFRRQSLA